MIVMGIDPSLASSGWAVVQKNGNSFKYIASGVVKTNAKQNLYNRLAFIKNKFNEAIALHKPQQFIIEVGFVMENSASSLKLAVARGVIIASIVDYLNSEDVSGAIHEVTPTFVKKSITGSGTADKIQVDKMVKIILSNIATTTFTNNDETDAIAISLFPTATVI